MTRIIPACRLCWCAGMVWLLCMTGHAAGDPEDVHYSSAEYAKLTSFEASVLRGADEKFAKKQYKTSGAAYGSYIVEFPTSAAVPYALLKRARSLQLQGLRYQAIREYQEVIDYFKNRVAYAAPAVYFQGQSHWDNGDEGKAVKVWITMAEDKDYSQHPLAAYALNKLGEYLVGHKRVDEGVGYYRQVATTFRRSNGDAARHAIRQVQYHFVRRSPNEQQLRAFYTQVKGFDHNPQSIPEDLAEDGEYWGHVMRLVRDRDHNRFGDDQKEQRRTYFDYWSKQMDGRLLNWDDYQLQLAECFLAADGNVAAYHKRLDEQFARKFEAGDFDRIIRWIREFRGYKEKQNEYYRKLDFAKMSNDHVVALVRAIYETMDDAEMGANTLKKVKWNELPDGVKTDLVWRVLWNHDRGQIEFVCNQFNDRARGRFELLKVYGRLEDLEKGVPLADELAKEADYAQSALTIKAELYEQAKRWQEAIATWRQVSNPPESDFSIAYCLEQDGKVEAAIAQLSTIETFFQGDTGRNYAPRAALAIAHVWKRAKQEDSYKATLQRVLQRYPKSRESGQAHRELEEMGVHVKIGGGVYEKD